MKAETTPFPSLLGAASVRCSGGGLYASCTVRIREIATPALRDRLAMTVWMGSALFPARHREPGSAGEAISPVGIGSLAREIATHPFRLLAKMVREGT